MAALMGHAVTRQREKKAVGGGGRKHALLARKRCIFQSSLPLTWPGEEMEKTQVISQRKRGRRGEETGLKVPDNGERRKTSEVDGQIITLAQVKSPIAPIGFFLPSRQKEKSSSSSSFAEGRGRGGKTLLIP